VGHVYTGIVSHRRIKIIKRKGVNMGRRGNLEEGTVRQLTTANAQSPASVNSNRDFKLSRADLLAKRYDVEALRAWFGEAHIRTATAALYHAGVVIPQRTTNPPAVQPSDAPIAESA
jgi:hypothetical protein